MLEISNIDMLFISHKKSNKNVRFFEHFYFLKNFLIYCTIILKKHKRITSKPTFKYYLFLFLQITLVFF